jgi:chorismate-pyruvate lyase
MSIVRSKPLADCTSPLEAYADLAAGFAGADSLLFDCEPVAPEEILAVPHELLVHHRHMTGALLAHYGSPVEVHVLERHHEGDLYSRKISLTLKGTSRIVEYGLVRLDFRHMSAEVRAEIIREQSPLGAILIAHNVLRRIQPRWYLRFPPESNVLKWYNHQNATPVYGRMGTIFCNGEPAIELCEIVTTEQGMQTP